jgi:hypothetical protein
VGFGKCLQTGDFVFGHVNQLGVAIAPTAGKVFCSKF